MLSVLLLLAATGQANDPLAQARAGKIQCVSPNAETKKCMAISAYTLNADGTFVTATTLLIAPQPLITMTVTAPGTVKGNELCGPVRKADFEAGVIQMDGQPAPAAMVSAIMPQVLASVAAIDGKMGCSVEAADGTVTVKLDGVAHPEMTQKTKWVSPADGYTLGQ